MTVYAECRAHHSAGSVDAVGWAKARSRRAHHFHERKDGGARLRFAHPDYPEEPRSGVSKDEWHQPGLVVRDGAARLLTMRV